MLTCTSHLSPPISRNPWRSSVLGMLLRRAVCKFSIFTLRKCICCSDHGFLQSFLLLLLCDEAQCYYCNDRGHESTWNPKLCNYCVWLRTLAKRNRWIGDLPELWFNWTILLSLSSQYWIPRYFARCFGWFMRFPTPDSRCALVTPLHWCPPSSSFNRNHTSFNALLLSLILAVILFRSLLHRAVLICVSCKIYRTLLQTRKSSPSPRRAYRLKDLAENRDCRKVVFVALVSLWATPTPGLPG